MTPVAVHRRAETASNSMYVAANALRTYATAVIGTAKLRGARKSTASQRSKDIARKATRVVEYTIGYRAASSKR